MSNPNAVSWGKVADEIQIAVNRIVQKHMKHDTFDPKGGFVLHWCKADIRRHIDELMIDLVEAWCK